MRGRFAATDTGRGIESDTKRTVEGGVSTAGPTKLERTLHGTISSGDIVGQNGKRLCQGGKPGTGKLNTIMWLHLH